MIKNLIGGFLKRMVFKNGFLDHRVLRHPTLPCCKYLLRAKSIDGDQIKLGSLLGDKKAVLVVNLASK